MVPAELAGAVAAVERWLALGRDVVLSGDVGSGRSAVLRRLASEMTANGGHVVRIVASRAASGSKYGALLEHDLVVQSRLEPGAGANTLVRLFSEELRGPLANVVVVDDVELLDPGSVQVVDRLTRVRGVRLVVSSRRATGSGTPGPLDALAATRVLAEARLVPLGFWGMSSLLTAHLGGPPDASLISTVVSRSAGNPGVACALVDAARFAGTIEPVDGLWTETGTFDTVPHDMVVRLLTRGMPPEPLAALEMLAWTGPVTFSDAVELVGADMLEALGDLERVTVYRSSRGEVVSVSPPALSHALRGGLGDVRRRVLGRRAEEAFGAAYRPVPTPQGELVERLVVGYASQDSEYLRSAAELASLVHERAAVQDASRRADWLADPSVRTAVSFLDALMARPEPEQLDEIFAGTPVHGTDPGWLVATFRARQAQWMLWRDQDLPQVTRFLRDHAGRLGDAGRLLEAQALMFEISWGAVVADAETVDRLDVGESDPHARTWSVLARAGLLLELGRAEESLQLVDEAPAPPADSPLRRYLEAARSDALLLLGRVDDAEQWARTLLEDSYDALDPLGIRVHSLKLAEVLYLTGQPDPAWQVLATSLRLGPPSPFGIAYYERTLALGVTLRADAGDLALARVLENDLADYPLTYRPVLGSMRAWARAAVLYAENDLPAADTVLREQGDRDRALHSLASALLSLSSRRTPYPPQDAADLEALYARAPLPLFLPLVRLHRAVAEQDEAAIVAALPRVSSETATTLSLTALDVLDRLRRDSDRPVLSPAEVEELTHSGMARRRTVGYAVAATGEDLTEREREVALLARAGLSNKDIAARLFISARTVENHMHRILKKLALDSRTALHTWTPPE